MGGIKLFLDSSSLEIMKTTEKITDIYTEMEKVINEGDLDNYNFMMLRLFKELNFKWLEFKVLLVNNSLLIANEVLSEIYEMQNSLEFIFLEADYKTIDNRIKALCYNIEQSRLIDSAEMAIYKDVKGLYDRLDDCVIMDNFTKDRIKKKDFDYYWADTCTKDKINSIEDLYKHVHSKTYSSHLIEAFDSLFKRDKEGVYTKQELLLIKQFLISYSSTVKDFIMYLLSFYHIPYDIRVDGIAALFEEISETQLATM